MRYAYPNTPKSVSQRPSDCLCRKQRHRWIEDGDHSGTEDLDPESESEGSDRYARGTVRRPGKRTQPRWIELKRCSDDHQAEKAEQVDPEVGLDQRWRRAADREETAEKDADDAECRAWEKGVQSDSAFVGLEPHSEDDKREADHRDHHQSGTEWEQSFVDEPAGNDPGQSRQRVGQRAADDRVGCAPRNRGSSRKPSVTTSNVAAPAAKRCVAAAWTPISGGSLLTCPATVS